MSLCAVFATGLMEVNLPELEATMHQISEENISGGGGHSVAWKVVHVIGFLI